MHIQDLIAARLSRRGMLGGLAGLPLLSLASACGTTEAPPIQTDLSSLTFTPVAATNADQITVPQGYSARTLIAWGDALFDGAPAFDPNALTRADQELRFGMNNDMLALFPAEYSFPPAREGTRMILCANHEYASLDLMFPSVQQRGDLTAAHAAAALASTGVSVVTLESSDGAWRPVRDARPGEGFNRRITPFTPVLFAGPAAQHPWIVAAGAFVNAHEPAVGPAPAGAVRSGTYANCAGGQTPWGTYLTSEENFYSLFHISNAAAPALAQAQHERAYRRDCARMALPSLSAYGALAPAQYDMAQNPHGPALYGWVVEIDPHDPKSTPRKRTALGRKNGECATTALARDGRVAVYMGDDALNEHVYKFVSEGRFNPNDRAANFNLLDTGALYAAKFEADGSGRWVRLTREAANAALAADVAPFATDADLFVRVRDAAQALGATPMDRPEDVEAILEENWVGRGQVFVVCTNNTAHGQARPANPDREGDTGLGSQANLAGHIVRIDEAGGDCGAESFTWEVFALAGDPDAQTAQTRAGPTALVATTIDGATTFTGDRFACPDNICFDASANVWIATDGGDAVFGDCNDSVLAAPTDPNTARNVKRFLVGPVGAEICGPTITPDGNAFLASIQHPGEHDVHGAAFAGRRWTGARPGSSFPDGGSAWPRSAVVIVTRDGGGKIGT